MQPQAQTPDLKALVERVEAATGPDRELDAQLWCLGEGVKFSHLSSQSEAIIFFRLGKNGTCREDGWPRYTASLDSSLALCERVLPGWKWSIQHNDAEVEDGPCFYARVGARRNGAWPGKTPALALLAAMLKALVAQAAPSTDRLVEEPGNTSSPSTHGENK